MLASITPLGERGRHRRYAITVAAFAFGGAGAGAALGAGLGAIGAAGLGGVSPTARLVGLTVALGLALAVDLAPGNAPGPRRQVDERWLDELRGWVYGLGYGAQLGIGVSTVINSAATYVALLAALLAAGAGPGAAILGLYGAIRGLTPLLAAGVRSPRQLLAFHAHLQAAQGPVLAAARFGLAAATALAMTGAVA